MKYIELTEFLVSSVIENRELFSVKETEIDDECISLVVYVSSEDIGRVIGRQGKTANAIRTIVQASLYEDFRKVRIDFQSYE